MVRRLPGHPQCAVCVLLAGTHDSPMDEQSNHDRCPPMHRLMLAPPSPHALTSPFVSNGVHWSVLETQRATPFAVLHVRPTAAQSNSVSASSPPAQFFTAVPSPSSSAPGPGQGAASLPGTTQSAAPWSTHCLPESEQSYAVNDLPSL